MKICIYGAGAIGTWLGAGLAQAGCNVSVVARGDALAAIQSQGLQRIDASGRSSFNVAASDNPADLGVQDLIIVAVKAPAMASIAVQLAPLMDANTMLMTAMNGVPWWFLNGFGGRFAGTRGDPCCEHHWLCGACQLFDGQRRHGAASFWQWFNHW
jgi:2-dehydropantoate 2-reductase